MDDIRSPSVINKTTNIKRPFTDVKGSGINVLGRMFNGSRYAWICSESEIKVFNVESGSHISSYNFATISRSSTKIASVVDYAIQDAKDELRKQTEHCLIVGYNADGNKAFLSFYHPHSCRVLETICFKGRITCLNLISSKKSNLTSLSGIIKMMSGVLAVGMEEGIVCVLDLKSFDLISGLYSFQNQRIDYYNSLMFIDVENDVRDEIKSKIAASKNSSQHVAFVLNADNLIDERRILIDCEAFDRNDIYVSCMEYIPQTMILAVGYNVGSFQLWDMNQLTCLHTAPVPREHTAIVQFGFQEPCNDPQQCCYLWIICESNRPEHIRLPFAVMYYILFRVKMDTTEGARYKNYVHCKKRFHMDLNVGYDFDGTCISSQVVSNRTSSMLGGRCDENEVWNVKINLFIVILETWNQSKSSNCISIAVFDMNQWYREQMPFDFIQEISQPYVNIIAVDKLSGGLYTFCDAYVEKDSIEQFLTFNSAEQYRSPSSLSFNVICFAKSKIIHLHLPGLQSHALTSIIKEGPMALVQPQRSFRMCRSVGLTPNFSVDYSDHSSINMLQMRNYVLTILLEQKKLPFLMRCVTMWSDGSLGVSFCTLDALINWSWDCISHIKKLSDSLCVPLFDFTGTELDRENYHKLNHCCKLIQIISDLLNLIYSKYKHCLLDGGENLKSKIDVISLLNLYVDVIVWSVDCGLLPEKVDTTCKTLIPAYIASIMDACQQRRNQLKECYSNNEIPLDGGLYLIDYLIEREPNYSQLYQQWERENCQFSDGLYPPSTVQMLVRMYLMQSIPMDTKHYITMYFLLDLCDYHNDEDITKKLLSFPSIVNCKDVVVNFAKLMWLVDHDRFEEAVDIIRDGRVRKGDIELDYHCKIMQVMVNRNESKCALRYFDIIEPILPSYVNSVMQIIIYLNNELVSDAFFVQRDVCLMDRRNDLLKCFFKKCDKMGILNKVLNLNLNKLEEEEFISYLNKCSHNKPAADDLKVLYFLNRRKFVQAICINREINHVNAQNPRTGGYSFSKAGTTAAGNIGRPTTRDLYVQAFSKTLPAITNKLIDHYEKNWDTISNIKAPEKCFPLSTVAKLDNNKSSMENFLSNAIIKTRELDLYQSSSRQQTAARGGHLWSRMASMPFLCTDNICSSLDNELNSNYRLSQTVSSEPLSFGKRKINILEPEPLSSKRFKRDTKLAEHIMETPKKPKDHISSVESEILRTPYVQNKMITKVADVTPFEFATPKSSILKNTATPRTKLAHKVGFNIPESPKIHSDRHATPSTSKYIVSFEEQEEPMSEEKPVVEPSEQTTATDAALVSTTHVDETFAEETPSTTSLLENINESVNKIIDSAFSVPPRPTISENVRTEQNTASSQTAISIVEDGSSTLTVHHLEPGVANELEIVHVVDGAYEKSSSTTDNRLQYQYNIDLVNVQPEGYDSSTGFYYYQVLEQKLENGNEEEVSPNYNIVVDSSAEVERENEIGGENSPSELQQQPVICDYGSVSRDTYETLATMESKFPPNNNGDDQDQDRQQYDYESFDENEKPDELLEERRHSENEGEICYDDDDDDDEQKELISKERGAADKSFTKRQFHGESVAAQQHHNLDKEFRETDVARHAGSSCSSVYDLASTTAAEEARRFNDNNSDNAVYSVTSNLPYFSREEINYNEEPPMKKVRIGSAMDHQDDSNSSRNGSSQNKFEDDFPSADLNTDDGNRSSQFELLPSSAGSGNFTEEEQQRSGNDLTVNKEIKLPVFFTRSQINEINKYHEILSKQCSQLIASSSRHSCGVIEDKINEECGSNIYDECSNSGAAQQAHESDGENSVQYISSGSSDEDERQVEDEASAYPSAGGVESEEEGSDISIEIQSRPHEQQVEDDDDDDDYDNVSESIGDGSTDYGSNGGEVLYEESEGEVGIELTDEENYNTDNEEDNLFEDDTITDNDNNVDDEDDTDNDDDDNLAREAEDGDGSSVGGEFDEDNDDATADEEEEDLLRDEVKCEDSIIAQAGSNVISSIEQPLSSSQNVDESHSEIICIDSDNSSGRFDDNEQSIISDSTWNYQEGIEQSNDLPPNPLIVSDDDEDIYENLSENEYQNTMHDDGITETANEENIDPFGMINNDNNADMGEQLVVVAERINQTNVHLIAGDSVQQTYDQLNINKCIDDNSEKSVIRHTRTINNPPSNATALDAIADLQRTTDRSELIYIDSAESVLQKTDNISEIISLDSDSSDKSEPITPNKIIIENTDDAINNPDDEPLLINVSDENKPPRDLEETDNLEIMNNNSDDEKLIKTNDGLESNIGQVDHHHHPFKNEQDDYVCDESTDEQTIKIDNQLLKDTTSQCVPENSEYNIANLLEAANTSEIENAGGGPSLSKDVETVSNEGTNVEMLQQNDDVSLDLEKSLFTDITDENVYQYLIFDTDNKQMDFERANYELKIDKSSKITKCKQDSWSSVEEMSSDNEDGDNKMSKSQMVCANNDGNYDLMRDNSDKMSGSHESEMIHDKEILNISSDVVENNSSPILTESTAMDNNLLQTASDVKYCSTYTDEQSNKIDEQSNAEQIVEKFKTSLDPDEMDDEICESFESEIISVDSKENLEISSGDIDDKMSESYKSKMLCSKNDENFQLISDVENVVDKKISNYNTPGTTVPNVNEEENNVKILSDSENTTESHKSEIIYVPSDNQNSTSSILIESVTSMGDSNVQITSDVKSCPLYVEPTNQINDKRTDDVRGIEQTIVNEAKLKTSDMYGGEFDVTSTTIDGATSQQTEDDAIIEQSTSRDIKLDTSSSEKPWSLTIKNVSGESSDDEISKTPYRRTRSWSLAALSEETSSYRRKLYPSERTPEILTNIEKSAEPSSDLPPVIKLGNDNKFSTSTSSRSSEGLKDKSCGTNVTTTLDDSPWSLTFNTCANDDDDADAVDKTPTRRRRSWSLPSKTYLPRSCKSPYSRDSAIRQLSNLKSVTENIREETDDAARTPESFINSRIKSQIRTTPPEKLKVRSKLNTSTEDLNRSSSSSKQSNKKTIAKRSRSLSNSRSSNVLYNIAEEQQQQTSNIEAESANESTLYDRMVGGSRYELRSKQISLTNTLPKISEMEEDGSSDYVESKPDTSSSLLVQNDRRSVKRKQRSQSTDTFFVVKNTSADVNADSVVVDKITTSRKRKSKSVTTDDDDDETLNSDNSTIDDGSSSTTTPLKKRKFRRDEEKSLPTYSAKEVVTSGKKRDERATTKRGEDGIETSTYSGKKKSSGSVVDESEVSVAGSVISASSNDSVRRRSTRLSTPQKLYPEQTTRTRRNVKISKLEQSVDSDDDQSSNASMVGSTDQGSILTRSQLKKMDDKLQSLPATSTPTQTWQDESILTGSTISLENRRLTKRQAALLEKKTSNDDTYTAASSSKTNVTSMPQDAAASSSRPSRRTLRKADTRLSSSSSSIAESTAATTDNPNSTSSQSTRKKDK